MPPREANIGVAFMVDPRTSFHKEKQKTRSSTNCRHGGVPSCSACGRLGPLRRHRAHSPNPPPRLHFKRLPSRSLFNLENHRHPIGPYRHTRAKWPAAVAPLVLVARSTNPPTVSNCCSIRARWGIVLSGTVNKTSSQARRGC